MKVLPIYKTPMNLNKETDYLKHDVFYFNDMIINYSKMFYHNHTDSNLIVYNTVEKYENVINNCIKYNLKECKQSWKKNKYRNKNIKNYFWIDQSHLTFLGNKILAKSINDLLNLINK